MAHASGLRLLERAATPFTFGSAALFAALSAARNKRFFHPDGDAYSATVRLEMPVAPTLPFPDGSYDGVVRFSRGIGLPENMPDFLGLAIKIGDLNGPGSDQDLVFVTSGGATLTRHLLVPTQTYSARPYSSVLPYETTDGRLVALGAEVEPGSAGVRTRSELAAAIDSAELAIHLWAAEVGHERTRIGEALLDDKLPQEKSAALRFNPWNTRPGLRPAGALNRLRRDTYSASQKARPDSEAI